MTKITPETLMYIVFFIMLLLGPDRLQMALLIIVVNYWLSIIAENTRKNN